MVSRVVLASSQERPSNVDGRLPLEEADHLGHGILWGNREEHVHVIRPHMSLFTTTLELFRNKRQGKLSSKKVMEGANR